LVLAAAYQQINADPRHGGNTDTLNIMTKLFGSFHPGGCQFLMGDGSVHFVSENINLAVYQNTAIRDNGLPVGTPQPEQRSRHTPSAGCSAHGVRGLHRTFHARPRGRGECFTCEAPLRSCFCPRSLRRL
jgi:prepilin-type processing-associated H-X9-DG protein